MYPLPRASSTVPLPTALVAPGLASLALAALLLVAPAPAAGQEVHRVLPETEVFRQTPGGKRLATVTGGTRVTVDGRQGPWARVTLQGWVPDGSVGPSGREDLEHVVASPGGASLRDRPEGRVVARLLRGFLLQRTEVGGEWSRVQRTGWMRAASLESAPAAPAAGSGASPSAAGPTDAAAPDSASASASTVAAEGDAVVVSGESVRLRAAPAGDTVASVASGATVRVMERRGPWARVRLEGWAPASELVPPDPDSVADLDVATLRANPEQYVGRRVHWTVRFISLERAEAVRTDFYEGEPFVLARAPDAAEGFVYLAVPPALLPQVRSLEPLQPMEVLARVRTGRSALMGVPVLELQAIY